MAKLLSSGSESDYQVQVWRLTDGRTVTVYADALHEPWEYSVYEDGEHITDGRGLHPSDRAGINRMLDQL